MARGTVTKNRTLLQKGKRFQQDSQMQIYFDSGFTVALIQQCCLIISMIGANPLVCTLYHLLHPSCFYYCPIKSIQTINISYYMNKAIILVLLLAALPAFEIAENLQVPRTNIGNESIACHMESAPQVTNGFATYFSDNVYACENWNHKAKSLTQCFVALNGVCGMKNSFCDHCVEVTNADGQSEKCRVIDFCDPSNCDFLDPGHLDVLDNNNRANYKFLDKGKYVVPYQGAGGQPVIRWRWTTC